MVAHLHVDTPLPETAVLCGIGFRIAESEGLIVFSERQPMWGMGCRFSFHRDSVGCWKVSIDQTLGQASGSMSPSRIARAFEIVQTHRGDCFGRPYPLPEGWSDKEWSELPREERSD